MVDLLDKEFKTTTLRMLKEVKENVKKVEETMYLQNGNNNKETENQKEDKKKFWRRKNTVTEMKKSLEGFRGSFEQTEEWANLKIIEITKSEEPKEKKIIKANKFYGTCWNTIKWTNIHIVGVLKGEERQKGQKEYLKK